LNEARSELCALYLGLKSDVDQCKDNLSDKHTGIWDRLYTRTLFSMVEGVSFRTRQYITSAVDAGLYCLDSPSLKILCESTYKLDSSGKIIEKDENLVFLPGFKFTFKTFGKCLEMEKFVEQAFSDNGFNNFKKSVEIRNRLTHSKRTQDMMVSGSELKLIESAEEWFHALVLPLIERAFEMETQANKQKQTDA
jgi:hypothetical protein